MGRRAGALAGLNRSAEARLRLRLQLTGQRADVGSQLAQLCSAELLGHAGHDRVVLLRQQRRHDAVPVLGDELAVELGALAELGAEVELWSRVGDDDNGVKIRRLLISAGVDARYVQAFDDNRSSTSVILVDDAGERMIIGSRDVNMPSGTSWLPLERIEGAAVVLADLRWLEGARAGFEAARMAGVPFDVFDAFYLATLGGARALDLEGTIGSFASAQATTPPCRPAKPELQATGLRYKPRIDPASAFL